MSQSEVALGTIAIITSFIFSIVSVYALYGRTLYYKKEEIRKVFGTFRKGVIVTVALINFIYSMVYVEGYKYIKFEIVALIKPVSYHLLIYVLVNIIALLCILMAVLSKNTYTIFMYQAYVIQWMGMIVIISNEIMFTSYVANILCASFLLLFLTPIVFIVPEGLKQVLSVDTSKKTDKPFDIKDDEEIVAFNSTISMSLNDK
jgi:hypothetical protein